MKKKLTDKAIDRRIQEHPTLHSWTIATPNSAAYIASLESRALGEHLGICKNMHGKVFVAHCAVESVRGFVASRLVTTLAIAVMLTGIAFSMR